MKQYVIFGGVMAGLVFLSGFLHAQEIPSDAAAQENHAASSRKPNAEESQKQNNVVTPKENESSSARQQTNFSVSVGQESTGQQVEIKPEVIEKSMPAYARNLKKLIEMAEENIKKVDKALEKEKVFKRDQEREEEIKKHFQKGKALYEEGKLKEAKEEWKKVLEMSSDPEMNNYIRETEKRSRKENFAKKRQEQEAAKRQQLEQAIKERQEALERKQEKLKLLKQEQERLEKEKEETLVREKAERVQKLQTAQEELAQKEQEMSGRHESYNRLRDQEQERVLNLLEQPHGKQEQ